MAFGGMGFIMYKIVVKLYKNPLSPDVIDTKILQLGFQNVTNFIFYTYFIEISVYNSNWCSKSLCQFMTHFF